MPLGAWGSVITFEVSAGKALTPNGVEVQDAARYAQQDTVALAPSYEFLGPGLAACTLNVRLAAGQGVSPRSVLDTLREAMRAGRAEALVIGGRPVFRAGSLAVIESLSERWEHFTGQGGLLVAEGTINFREIVPRNLVPPALPEAASSTVTKTGVEKRL